MDVRIDGVKYVPEGGAPVTGGEVPPITGMPNPYANLGTSNSDPAEKQVAPNQAVSVAITLDGSSRNLKWAGSPGAFFKRYSWAIFNTGGTKLGGADNQVVVGTLGATIDAATLAGFGQGDFVAAFSADAAGNIGAQLM